MMVLGEFLISVRSGSFAFEFGFPGVECASCNRSAFTGRKGSAFAADLAVHGFSSICPGAILAVDVDVGLLGLFGMFIAHRADRPSCCAPKRWGDVLIGQNGQAGLIAAKTKIHQMLAKFAINYTVFPEHNKHVDTHHTDDPVEAESFLVQLLISGARIHSIHHEGVPVETHRFDHLLKVAANRVAAGFLSRSLHLDYAEVKHRFGFAS